CQPTLASPGGIHRADAPGSVRESPGKRRVQPTTRRTCARSWLDQSRAVIVGRVAIDRVDVVEGALLRGVLDDERWPLDAKVCELAILRAPAPGKPGLRQIRLDLRHLRRRGLVVEDAYPFVRQVEQQGLLPGVQHGRADAFRLNDFSIGAWPEHE